MNVEYTGRQYEITPVIRKEVETGLAKLRGILGETFKSKVILTLEKHRNIAEITITRRKQPIVGLAESADMLQSVNEALGHIEKQALKHNGRKRTIKRQSKDKWNGSAVPLNEATMAVGASASTSVPVTVHRFPAATRVSDVHLESSPESVALRPMTLEEAVKECEFRDRDVFVFRDKKGQVKVLHRKRDGKMELIDVP
jgi:putative sigma-54 modulation protein